MIAFQIEYEVRYVGRKPVLSLLKRWTTKVGGFESWAHFNKFRARMNEQGFEIRNPKEKKDD